MCYLTKYFRRPLALDITFSSRPSWSNCIGNRASSSLQPRKTSVPLSPPCSTPIQDFHRPQRPKVQKGWKPSAQNLAPTRCSCTTELTCMTLAKTLFPLSESLSTRLMMSSRTHCLNTNRGFAPLISVALALFTSANPVHSARSSPMRAAYRSSHPSHSPVAAPWSSLSCSTLPSSNFVISWCSPGQIVVLSLLAEGVAST